MRDEQRKHTVAIVSPFVAHYREALMHKLLESRRHHYILVGDTHDPNNSGIKAWMVMDISRFIRTPCRVLKGRYLIQGGLVRLARRRDIQVIIYSGDAQSITTWVSATLARLSGKRVLFWTHGWIRQESGLKGWIRCAFYRLGHGLLLYGNRAKSIGIQKGFRPEDLYVIYNSLDYELQKALRARVTPERLAHVRRELFENPHRPMIIYISRLTEVRRLDLLLEAMCILREQHHDVNLLLVGDGPERAALEKLAAQYNLPIGFYGECYNEEILAELTMAANVTVAPGQVGLTAIHSLAYGTPVITHDDLDRQGPEWEAIVPGVNGGFFRYGDVSDLARVVREWTESEFPDERSRSQCYDVVDRFYNPEFQCYVIERAVSGEPADDSFQMREDIATASYDVRCARRV